MTAPSPPTRKRILTGDRPSGRLHLGHLVGSLHNRVKLQYEYDTIIIVADLHTLTTQRSREDIQRIPDNVRGMMLDYLAAGMDPNRATFYLQSAIPEIHELNTMFQNLVGVNRLSRVPSLKEMARNADIGDDAVPYGLLGYPVLQAADILLPRAELVPVGKDNLANVEVAREIARRFNHLYGAFFPEPEPLLSETPTLVGTDGAGRMSKSAGNTILLSDDATTVAKKVRGMFTDPARVHADVPGTVEGNPVFIFHDLFNPATSEVRELERRYREGTIGDGEVKDSLISALNRYMQPLRERMATFEAQPGFVDELLLDGTHRMQQIGQQTLREVRKLMGLDQTMVRARRAVQKHRKDRIARGGSGAGEGPQ